MRAWKRTSEIAVLVLAVLAGCSSADADGVAGPMDPLPVEDPPGDPPPEPTDPPPNGGAAGSLTTDAGAPCGAEGLDCCSEGVCDVGLVCNSEGTCQAQSAPPPSTECGLAGQACCTTGDACPGALGKAQCCTECTGSPEFTCQCSESLVAGGSCKLCCAVCNDGHIKTSPIEVTGSATCQMAANDWCQQNRGVGADAKSGWKNSCG
jgi:hypothetical protein